MAAEAKGNSELETPGASGRRRRTPRSRAACASLSRPILNARLDQRACARSRPLVQARRDTARRQRRIRRQVRELRRSARRSVADRIAPYRRDRLLTLEDRPPRPMRNSPMSCGAPSGTGRLSLTSASLGAGEFSTTTLALDAPRPGRFGFQGDAKGKPLTLALAGEGGL